jgi:hypothetical protein
MQAAECEYRRRRRRVGVCCTVLDCIELYPEVYVWKTRRRESLYCDEAKKRASSSLVPNQQMSVKGVE